MPRGPVPPAPPLEPVVHSGPHGSLSWRIPQGGRGDLWSFGGPGCPAPVGGSPRCDTGRYRAHAYVRGCKVLQLQNPGTWPMDTGSRLGQSEAPMSGLASGPGRAVSGFSQDKVAPSRCCDSRVQWQGSSSMGVGHWPFPLMALPGRLHPCISWGLPSCSSPEREPGLVSVTYSREL